jgi:transcription elongation factor Elf1
MQSLESSFFLIALGRYPHALAVCASAIESSLQAADINGKEKDGFQDLVKKAKRKSASIESFGSELLDRFRETRNRITHRGFSPQDDSESVSLYLEIGLPFLSLCYREFHAFDLMGGLLIEYVEHINIAQKVFALAKASPSLDISYCLNSFSHLIRWCFKRNFSAGWEINALVRSDEIGRKFEHMYAEKQELERLFDAPYSFNCPVCDEIESVVAELDSAALDLQEIKPIRMACSNCGFVVSNSQPYLSQALLEEQVLASRASILKEYGIE